jgi:hypothetical protein
MKAARLPFAMQLQASASFQSRAADLLHTHVPIRMPMRTCLHIILHTSGLMATRYD